MHLRSPLTFIFHLNIITNIFPITEMVTMLVTERSSPEMIPYGKAKVEIIKQTIVVIKSRKSIERGRGVKDREIKIEYYSC